MTLSLSLSLSLPSTKDAQVLVFPASVFTVGRLGRLGLTTRSLSESDSQTCPAGRDAIAVEQGKT